MNSRMKVAAIVGATAMLAGGVGALASASSTATGQTYTPLSQPVRILDTRTTGTALASNGVLKVPVSTVAPGASAVSFNLTAVPAAGSSGYLVAYPDGTARPSAGSNLNFSGAALANFDIAPVSNGYIDISGTFSGTVNVLVDVEGYFTGPSPAPTSTSPTAAPSTTTPAPTTSSPAPTGTGLPVAPAGYTDVFYDSFTKAASLGTFGTQNGDTPVYTGDHSGAWTSYPDGWGSTNSSCGYNPASVLSVGSQGLDFFLHNSTGSVCNGSPVGANLHPVVNPTGANGIPAGYFTYGRVSVTMSETGAMGDFHAVPLLWPVTDSNWTNAESDWPEFTMNYPTANHDVVCYYAHVASVSGGQDSMCLPSSFDPRASHTYTTQWLPTGTSYFVDNTLVGTSTARTWNQPERVQLQFEPTGRNDGDSGHVDVTNFELDQYNGSGSSTQSASPSPSGTTASPTLSSTSPSPSTSAPTPTTTPTTTTSTSQPPSGSKDHVVVVLLENHDRSQVIGAPYIASLASQGANFTDDVGFEHPSLPNYLALSSGSDQGQNGNDACITSPADNVFAHGAKEYAESLGSGNPTQDNGEYACRHNPAAQYSSGVGASSDFSAFPTTAAGYAALPKLSYITPNLISDMHDGTVAQGDAWLKANIDGYAQWAKTHNSELVVTWDENSSDTDLTTPVATIVVGQGVSASTPGQKVNHLNTLAQVADWAGIPRLAGTVGIANLGL